MAPTAKQVHDPLLTVAETCRYLQVTPRTLYRYIKDQHMPAFKLGKEWRFVRSDLDRWLRQRTLQTRG
jgi:excisionase family DNA binding protein